MLQSWKKMQLLEKLKDKGLGILSGIFRLKNIL